MQKEFPMDLTGSVPVSGKILNERGFSFFQENRKYNIGIPDTNGIVRVFSQCHETGPDEDGYGSMAYFDWWMMDTDLEPIPGVKVFYNYSPPALFGSGMKEKWNEQYNIAVEVLKNRK